jgi:hypothetical protein
MTKSYDDAIFVRALPDGTIVETAVERELFGSEKSWELQDLTLRKARRAVDIASWGPLVTDRTDRSEARKLLAACRREKSVITEPEFRA